MTAAPPPKGSLTVAIIPAAGLGSRLQPLSLGCPKELLPLGNYPALIACLLEADAAQVTDVVLVVSPHKPGLQKLSQALAAIDPKDPDHRLSPPTRALAALWHRLRVRLVEQPQPLGVLDAIARGRAGCDGAVFVLFPDLLHLPDQTALTHLATAHAGTQKAVFGLRLAPPQPPIGSTLAVQLAPPFATLPSQALPIATPLPIVALRPSQGRPDEILTTFGQVQTPAWDAALDRFCRDPQGGALCDGPFLSALNALAAAGELYGTLLSGEILDLGSLAGYAAAVQRFSVESARFRGVP